MPDQETLPAWTPPPSTKDAAALITRLSKTLHEEAYTLGLTLIWVKKQLGHGDFIPWVEKNIWFGKRTAQRMITFARRCEKAGRCLEYHPQSSRHQDKSVTVTLLSATKRKDDEDATAKALAQKISQYLESLTTKQRAKAIATIDGTLGKYRPGPELPAWLDVETWQAYGRFRSEIKKPMTLEIEKYALKTLARLRAQGCDPTEVIEQSIVSGWTGLFPVKRPPPTPEDKLKAVLTRGL
jgi:hypothetical protein